jgi:predicted Fe-Mo cluster-binding NifX family protein
VKVKKPRSSKKGSTSKTLPDGAGADVVVAEEPKPMAAQVAPEAAMRVVTQSEEGKTKVQEAIETINRRASEKKEAPIVNAQKPEIINSFDDVGDLPDFLKRK